MRTHHHGDRSHRPTSPPGRGHRLGFLLGAAALGAVGVAMIAPHASATTEISADAGATNTASIIRSIEQAASRGTVRVPLAEKDAAQSLPAAQAADALAQSRVRALNDPRNHPRAATATAAPNVTRTGDTAATAGVASTAVTNTPSSAPDEARTQPQTGGAGGPDAYRAYARSKVSAAQFSCLDALWAKESGWRATAHNPYSSAYGIPQLLDSTWAATGIAMTSNGYRQVDAGLAYIAAAYGTPCSAWAHSQATNWY